LLWQFDTLKFDCYATLAIYVHKLRRCRLTSSQLLNSTKELLFFSVSNEIVNLSDILVEAEGRWDLNVTNVNWRRMSLVNSDCHFGRI
jgi:hypothetical protein